MGLSCLFEPFVGGVSDDIPAGTIYLIPPRRRDESGYLETIEEWAKRCCVMKGFSIDEEVKNGNKLNDRCSN